MPWVSFSFCEVTNVCNRVSTPERDLNLITGQHNECKLTTTKKRDKELILRFPSSSRSRPRRSFLHSKCSVGICFVAVSHVI